MARRRAVDGFAAGELVRTILRARTEVSAHAELTEEAPRRARAERVEGEGVPLIGGECLDPVAIDDALHALGDLAERVVPRDRLEGAVGPTALGRIAAIGVRVEGRAGETLVAREAARHRVVAVRAQRDELVVFDPCDEPAARFAHATERVAFDHPPSLDDGTRGARRVRAGLGGRRRRREELAVEARRHERECHGERGDQPVRGHRENHDR